MDYYSMSEEELKKFLYDELLTYVDFDDKEWIEHYKKGAIFLAWSDANDFLVDCLSLDEEIEYHTYKGDFLWVTKLLQKI